jgi:hypothetical protein
MVKAHIFQLHVHLYEPHELLDLAEAAVQLARPSQLWMQVGSMRRNIIARSSSSNSAAGRAQPAVDAGRQHETRICNLQQQEQQQQCSWQGPASCGCR